MIIIIRCRKSERKVNLKQFEDAVRMLSEKKYPGDPKAMEKMKAKLMAPTTHPGATVRHNREHFSES